MKTCKVLMTNGGLGSGIVEAAFDRGIELSPDIIVADGGSTDSGPSYLGRAQGKYTRELVKNDLAMMIKGGHKLGVPVMVGSCGLCGTDSGVDLFAEIVEEIFQEEGFRMKVAKIYTQQDAKVLKEKMKQGKIHKLAGAPDITETTFDECSNIVAVAGAEPFIKALKDGAQVVLCGRATDTADIAALPIMMGCHEGAAWHAGKTVECGGLCTTDPLAGCIMAEIDEKGFKVYPTSADTNIKCTPYTVAAHMLYENADPFILIEPSGRLDTSKATYTQIDDRSVYVEGSTFTHTKQYTMKLEGAGPAGYQTFSLVGITDKKVCANPLKWEKILTTWGDAKLKKAGFPMDDFDYNFKFYGYNGVTGIIPKEGTPPPREMLVMFTVTAKTQKLATEVSKLFGPGLLHAPIDLTVQMPSFAFPFSPAFVERGQLYEFKLLHVVDLDDPLEFCRIEYVD